MVFDLTRRATFDAVRKWKEDLDSKVMSPDGAKVDICRQYFEGFINIILQIPTILLANKSDLTEQRSVTDDEVYKMSQELGFTSWYSVSARDGDNVETAGDRIVAFILEQELGLDRADKIMKWSERGIVLEPGQKKKRKCC